MARASSLALGLLPFFLVALLSTLEVRSETLLVTGTPATGDGVMIGSSGFTYLDEPMTPYSTSAGDYAYDSTSGNIYGKDIKKTVMGAEHMVVLTSEHKLVVFGAAAVGGDGTAFGAEMTSANKIIDVAAGDGWTAYIDGDGGVYVKGTICSGGSTFAETEITIADDIAISIVGGLGHLCAITGKASLYCVGQYDGSTCVDTFTKMSDTHTVLDAVCGDYHTLYLARSTTENTDLDATAVYAFGKNTNEQCGVDTTGAAQATAVEVPLGGLKIVSMGASDLNSFLVDTQGILYGFGEGTLIGGDSTTPVACFGAGAEALENIVVARVFAGGNNVLVTTGTGHAYVWGDNNNGGNGRPLGTGTGTIATPTEIANVGDLGTARIQYASVSSTVTAITLETTCSWFSMYRQLDYDLDDGAFNRTQGRRDLTACGMCAGYGEQCTYSIHPIEVKTGDFGRVSIGGLCEPTDKTNAIATDRQKDQGKHFRACSLDDWLLQPRSAVADDPPVLFRSDTWLPYAQDTLSTAAFQEVVWPNLYARYHVNRPHPFVVLRMVVMTHDVRNLGDNIDLIASHAAISNCHLLTLDNYDYTSIRESNPWAIDVSQTDVDTYGANGFCIAVYGDNQYPQKAGPSEFKMKVWWEPDFPDFDCDGAADSIDACYLLTSHSNAREGATLASMQQNLVQIGEADRWRYKTGLWDSSSYGGYGMRINRRKPPLSGASTPARGTPELNNGFFWDEMVYVKDGFETNFAFRVQNHYLCNGDDGFCGGGDGFVFYVHGYDGTIDPAVVYAAAGDAGGQDLGVKDLEKILVVEFDTWHNPDYYDPKQGVEHWWINATEYVSYADNHIAIFAAAPDTDQAVGDPHDAMVLDHSKSTLIAATPSIPDLSDGEEHTVKIWYLPAFGSTHPGTVTIFIDNMERPVLVGEITLVEHNDGDTTDPDGTLKPWEVLTEDGGAYVGFLGAQNDAPQDLTITQWNFNRFPGRVGY